jgi:hypothetical protein
LADSLGRVITFDLPMKRGISREPFGDPHHFFAEQPQLLLNRVVLDLSGLGEDPRRLRHWDHVGHRPSPQRAHREPIVLTTCSPCVPPAALIKPITSSWRYGGSRVPSICSQSIAFLNEPETDPLYIGLLHSIPSAS